MRDSAAVLIKANGFACTHGMVRDEIAGRISMLDKVGSGEALNQCVWFSRKCIFN